MPSVSPVNNEPKIANKGFWASQIIGGSVTLVQRPLHCIHSRFMGDCIRTNAKENRQINKAIKNILESTGLKDKGVKLIKVAEVAGNVNNNELATIIKNSATDKRTIKLVKENYKESKIIALLSKLGLKDEKQINRATFKLYSQIKKGKNACYLNEKNVILAPNKSIQTALFHEVGHALNFNYGNFSNILKNMSIGTALLSQLFLILALTDKRKENDETSPDDSFIQKTKDFSKRNIGKLTFACLLPKLIEEARASIRGNKLAKEQMSCGTITKELFNKIRLTHLNGFISYLIPVIVAVLSYKAMVKVKDRIQSNYEKVRFASALTNQYVGTQTNQNTNYYQKLGTHQG